MPFSIRVPLLVILLGVSVANETHTWGDEPVPPLTGSRLRDELQKPINVTLPQIRVRDCLKRLSEIHQIAILLDRRVDPDQQIDVQLSQVTLDEGLEFLAELIDADATVVSGTIVIAPPQALDRMRTEIAIQHQLLHDSPVEAAQKQSFALLVGKTLRWDDLTKPSDLLASIAEQFDVTVTDIDLIPHDLWAAGVMNDVSAIEALTLVAGQFELSCQWSDDFLTVQLVPANGRQTIERTHSVNAKRFAEMKSILPEVVPLAEVAYRQGRLSVIATVGEHERIASLLKPEQEDSATPTPVSVPLRNRTFTLKTEQAAVGAILRTLESQGTQIEYDPAALRAAGVSLNEKITLNLEQATADEFFQAVCQPVGLQYEIEGQTLRLSPRP
ncbi:MAG: STN domain-containing protein [Planctomycetaceae bacterium]|nr:STN domain-containing protein [Planctomycetaceae bacterium]